MEPSLIVEAGWGDAALPDTSASLRMSGQLAYAKFPSKTSSTASVYEIVTVRLLDKMASGVVPWHRPWTQGAPVSFQTGKEYRGVNFFALGCSEFSSRYWLTYKQTQAEGGFVKRGSEGTKVIYWLMTTPDRSSTIAVLEEP